MLRKEGEVQEEPEPLRLSGRERGVESEEPCFLYTTGQETEGGKWVLRQMRTMSTPTLRAETRWSRAKETSPLRKTQTHGEL